MGRLTAAATLAFLHSFTGAQLQHTSESAGCLPLLNPGTLFGSPYAVPDNTTIANRTNALFGQLLNRGATLAQLSLPWADIETIPGQPNYAIIAEILKSAWAEGLTPLFNLAAIDTEHASVPPDLVDPNDPTKLAPGLSWTSPELIDRYASVVTVIAPIVAFYGGPYFGVGNEVSVNLNMYPETGESFADFTYTFKQYIQSITGPQSAVTLARLDDAWPGSRHSAPSADWLNTTISELLGIDYAGTYAPPAFPLSVGVTLTVGDLAAVAGSGKQMAGHGSAAAVGDAELTASSLLSPAQTAAAPSPPSWMQLLVLSSDVTPLTYYPLFGNASVITDFSNIEATFRSAIGVLDYVLSGAADGGDYSTAAADGDIPSSTASASRRAAEIIGSKLRGRTTANGTTACIVMQEVGCPSGYDNSSSTDGSTEAIQASFITNFIGLLRQMNASSASTSGASASASYADAAAHAATLALASADSTSRDSGSWTYARASSAASTSVSAAGHPVRAVSLYSFLDMSPSDCEGLSKYYNTSAPAFIEYLCTLGLVRYDDGGLPKKAFAAFLDAVTGAVPAATAASDAGA